MPSASMGPARRWEKAVKQLRKARQELEKALKVHAVARGDLVAALNNGMRNLTLREQDVLALVKERLGNKEIAARLFISERTVKFHVSSLLAKFGAENRRSL
jgi:DNA-binding CsgD family transcriptional regulator